MPYVAPKIAPKYEPPAMLDLSQFSAIQGDCCTGGGSCNGEVISLLKPQDK